MKSFTKYRNPWYDYRNRESKEWFSIEPEVQAQEYREFILIRHPYRDQVDIIKLINEEYTCVSQVGTVRYAKAFIDNGCVHGDYREDK